MGMAERRAVQPPIRSADTPLGVLTGSLVVPPDGYINNGVDPRFPAGSHHTGDQVGFQVGVLQPGLRRIEAPAVMPHGEEIDRVDAAQREGRGKLIFVKTSPYTRDVFRCVEIEMNLPQEGLYLFHKSAPVIDKFLRRAAPP